MSMAEVIDSIEHGVFRKVEIKSVGNTTEKVETSEFPKIATHRKSLEKRMRQQPFDDFLTHDIKNNAEKIAGILYSGKDVEIRKNKDGISIAEISKKVVKR